MTVDNGEITFKNCKVGLSTNLAAGSGVRSMAFINCVVDYEGGSVPLSLYRFTIAFLGSTYQRFHRPEGRRLCA